MNKKIYKVKFQYFNDNILRNTKKPTCLSPEIGEFLFNWSLETSNQFSKHIMNMVPTKFYISSSAEIEAITMKKDIFEKIIELYDKTGNKRLDKFELIALFPFIVSNDFYKSLISALSFFCLENENDLITKNELSLFFDSYFRCLHNFVIVDKIDEVYEKTNNNIVKLVDNELDELVNNIMKNTEEIGLDKVTK